MFRPQIKTAFLPLILLIAGALGSACSFGNISAQQPATQETVTAAATRPAESPTPAYKKPKRVSRDVLDSDREKKEEPAKKKKSK